jgi:serine/threonine-protein kinase PknK
MGVDFERLRRLVVDALDVAREERDRFLSERCADHELLDAARGLLRHDTETPSGVEDEEPPLEDPKRIGRYPISQRIAAGGMGVVYLATDPTLDREVAIKRVPDWLASDSGALERFREEARILAQLNHPNIATIHSLETDGSRSFLTMEFVPGESLASALRRGPLELDSALHLMRGVAAALEAAHEKGIAHRDLKPHNIMVSGTGEAKVLDFGLAVRVGERASSRRELGSVLDPSGPGDAGWSPRSWTSAGTPGYMSPERVRGEHDDFTADAWSFGCVLFECLAGVRAFGGSPEERIQATLHDSAPMEALPAAVPAPLRQLIEQCLVKRTDERLASLGAARQRLEAVAERRERERLGSLHARGAPASALPHYLSRFLGREREILEVRSRLHDHRLVTLVGFGGCGKTRLAVEALSPSGENAVWVDLLAVENQDQVAVAMLTALNVPAPATDPVSQLCQILLDAELVLLIDNCDYLITTCQEIVHRILSQCPGVRVLATSREPLQIGGESVIVVSPLPVPAVGSARDDNPSVSLFLDRAYTLSPALELSETDAGTAAEICRRVEGIPLALEIAASQLDVLSLAELRDRLERPLELSQSSQQERHRSLRAVIDSSFQRLSPLEQSLLCRMSVFPGSWTLEAAEAVGLTDATTPWRVFELVKSLVRKSLVQRVQSAATETTSRFLMLETVSDFAKERLRASGEESSANLAVIGYYRSMFSEEEGSRVEVWRGAEKFRSEEDNVAGAVDAAAIHCSIEEYARLVLSLCPIWRHCGRYREGIRRCRGAVAALDQAGTEDRSIVCALLAAEAELALRSAGIDECRGAAGRAYDLAVELGHPGLLAKVLNVMGGIERRRDRLPDALDHFDRALDAACADGDQVLAATTRFHRGVVLLHLARADEAEAELRASLQTRESIGDQVGIADSINALGVIASMRGRYEDARKHYEEALAIKRRTLNTQGLVTSFVNLSRVTINLFRSLELDRDLLAQSRAYSDEGIALAKKIGDRWGLGTLYLSRASAEGLGEGFEEAEATAWLGIRAARAAGSVRYEAAGLDLLAKLAFGKGDHAQAESLGRTSFQLFLKREPASAYQPLRTIAHARLGLGDPRGALVLLAASRAAAARISGQQSERDEEAARELQETVAGRLDEAEFAAALRLGETTPLEQILERLGISATPG